MYAWLLKETLDVRFILLVIFGFFVLVGSIGAVHGYIKGPQIKDGTGKRRATPETPDPERAPEPEPETPRHNTVRFVDADEDGPAVFVDTETGEQLTDEEARSRLSL